MEQLGKCLDLNSPNFSYSKEESLDLAPSNIQPDHSFDEKVNLNNSLVSSEELKIRDQLESDIEKALEEEIKDELCRLTLRLHRLYQHRNQRTDVLKNDLFSELNITIKKEGGCKIEINESKRDVLSMVRPRTLRSEPKQGRVCRSTRQFDWARSLRSGSGSIAISKKHEISHHDQMLKNEKSPCSNVEQVRRKRRNWTDGSIQLYPGKVYARNISKAT